MPFHKSMLTFLSDLEQNNNREWFKANKKRYEAELKEPALAFIREFSRHLPTVSPHIEAVAKAQGGSLFRIYRDTRFSNDKTPYKTHLSMNFRHERTSKDVHAPGFYFHIEPGGVFIGAGMWGPDIDMLKRMRDAIVADHTGFSAMWEETQSMGWSWFGDNVLKRGPKGYDPEHPAIEFLKRKSFAATRSLEPDTIFDDGFARHLADVYAEASPLMAFECEAIGLAY